MVLSKHQDLKNEGAKTIKSLNLEELINSENDLDIPSNKEQEDNRTIEVSIQCLEHIKADHPVTFAYVKSYFNNELLDISEKSIVIDEKVQLDRKFSLTLNVLNDEEINNLISKPLLLAVYQFPGDTDPEIMDQLERSRSAIASYESKLSFDSAISQYELFTGVAIEDKEEIKKVTRSADDHKTIDRAEIEGSVLSVDRKREEKDKNKTRKSLRKSESDTRRYSSTTKTTEREDPTGTILGICSIDLLPLVLSNNGFTVSCELKQMITYQDDRMTTYKNIPKIIATLSMENSICLQSPTILSFSLDSIFNVTSMLKQASECSVCAWIPIDESYEKKQIFLNGTLIESEATFEMKYWPDTPRFEKICFTTDYRNHNDYDNVKHNFGNVKIEDIIKMKNPRIVFNYIKRNILLETNRIILKNYLTKYRQILIEVYVNEDAQTEKTQTSSRVNTGSKNSLSAFDDKKKKVRLGYVHLMALIDISSLIYPGVTSTRALGHLTTYQEKEVFAATGIRESHFVVKRNDIQAKRSEDRVKKPIEGTDKKSNKSAHSGATEKKKDIQTQSGIKSQLAGLQVSESTEEASTKVYNESGDPMVIVIEVELSEPLTKPRPKEDLLENLSEILPVKPNLSKLTINSQSLEANFRNLISEMSYDLKDIYQKYMTEKQLCECPERTDFLSYLRRTGTYQKHMDVLIKSISVLVHKRFEVDESFLKRSNKQHQELIGQMYVYLIEQMNRVLNKQSVAFFTRNEDSGFCSSESNLFYAKEATEMKNYALADKYYSERLCINENNADVWFDYALYHIEMDSKEMAFEYFNEALSRKLDHTNSLLAYGILLAEKGKTSDAETCFMTVLVHHPRWVEAWGILLLFHQRNNNAGGVSFAEDMAIQYINDKRVDSDYFMTNEELAWTSKVCPNTVYFKTAVLLLKLRMYQWVEDALAYEIATHPGIVNYLLAVICYYQEDYDHALDHLNEAKFFEGWNYAIVSLTGHCLLWKRKYREAKEQFYYVIESYNRPDDMHLLYINCARCLCVLGEEQEARKLVLKSLKYNSTPYAWLIAGTLFYYQNDLMSAEECFTSANFCNNRLPEVWGFLSMINLKMERNTESELCYHQAIRNHLEDENLLAEMKQEFLKYQEKYAGDRKSVV